MFKYRLLIQKNKQKKQTKNITLMIKNTKKKINGQSTINCEDFSNALNIDIIGIIGIIGI